MHSSRPHKPALLSRIAVRRSLFVPPSIVQVNVTLAGLQPVHPFTLSCYAEDWSMGPSLTAGPHNITVRTLCCHTLSPPLLPPHLQLNEPSTVLQFTHPQSFNASLALRVTVSSAHYTGPLLDLAACMLAPPSAFHPNISLHLSPSSTFALNTTTSTATFTLYGTLPGCYRVSYTLSGAGASLFHPLLTAHLLILPSNSTLPAPRLLSAAFSDDATHVIFNFNSPTITASNPSLSCAGLLTPSSPFTTCYWPTPYTLLATLNRQDTTLRLDTSTNITLQGGLLRAPCHPSHAPALCAAYNTTTTTNITLHPPLPLLPAVRLIGPERVGRCDNVTVRSLVSRGHGGRPVSYYWAVTSPTGGSVMTISAFLQSINEQVRHTCFYAFFLHRVVPCLSSSTAQSHLTPILPPNRGPI